MWGLRIPCTSPDPISLLRALSLAPEPSRRLKLRVRRAGNQEQEEFWTKTWDLSHHLVQWYHSHPASLTMCPIPKRPKVPCTAIWQWLCTGASGAWSVGVTMELGGTRAPAQLPAGNSTALPGPEEPETQAWSPGSRQAGVGCRTSPQTPAVCTQPLPGKFLPSPLQRDPKSLLPLSLMTWQTVGPTVPSSEEGLPGSGSGHHQPGDSGPAHGTPHSHLRCRPELWFCPNSTALPLRKPQVLAIVFQGETEAQRSCSSPTPTGIKNSSPNLNSSTVPGSQACS